MSGLLCYLDYLPYVQILLIKALRDFNERIRLGCINSVLYFSIGSCFFIYNVEMGKTVLVVFFDKFANKFF